MKAMLLNVRFPAVHRYSCPNLLPVLGAIVTFFSGVAIGRSVALGEAWSDMLVARHFGYTLTLSCIAVLLLILFRPASWRARLLFLASGYVIFGVLNAVDLTMFHYFDKPLVAVYDHLPRPESQTATLANYWSVARQYVPLPYILITLIATAPAFSVLALIPFTTSFSKIPAASLVALVLAGWFMFQSWELRAGLSASASTILSIDPSIERKKLYPADRTRSIVVHRPPKHQPRTIILILNEATSAFYSSSQDAKTPLADRLIALSGAPKEWIFYDNAVTNSSCTDVSQPSLFTGTGSHESFDKLHRMPFVFDIAKARGYHTAFYTSQTIEWANFDAFFSGAKIDKLVSASSTGQPLINDLGIDDIFIAKLAAEFILKAGAADIFLVVGTNAMHGPFQSSGDIAFPPGMTNRLQRALFILEESHKIIFDALHASGRFEGALIIVTADHGQNIDDSRRKLFVPRVESYSEPVLRVPLLVRPPRDLPDEMARWLRSNQRALISNIDIAPTIADLLNVGLADGLTYKGFSLFREVPLSRLSVATSTNEWRSWPDAAIALARKRERFVCGGGKLCVYYTTSAGMSGETVPLSAGPKWSAYLREALQLPIIAKSISDIYHKKYALTWSPARRVVPRDALSSNLGRMSDIPSGGGVIRAEAGHPATHILYGPYWQFSEGLYDAEVVLELGAGGEVGERLCNLDVYDGGQVLGSQEIVQDAHNNVQRAAVHFAVPTGTTDKRYEIRLWCSGAASVTVKEVVFQRLD